MSWHDHDTQAVTFATEEARRKDKRQREIAELKQDIRMFFHGVFWRFMWTTRLATPYSRFACRFGFYSKFPDGRCQYCGKQTPDKTVSDKTGPS